MHSTISSKEWRFVWLIVVIAIVVTSIPYVYGWLTTPPGKQYTGIHQLTPGDINVYLSFIEQARQGSLLFQNLYSPEAKPSVLFHPQWNILAFFGQTLHLSNILVFQLARNVLIVVFLFLIYSLFSYFISEVSWRKIGFTLVVFATGLGLFIPVTNTAHYLRGEFSVDLWVPEALTFLTIFHNPLFILALIIILFIFITYLKDQDAPGYKKSLVAGGLALLLGLVHPYDLVIVFGVLVVYFFGRILFDPSFDALRAKLYIKKVFVIGLVALPALVEYVYVYGFVSGYKGWGSQNVTLSPSVWWYVSGYGVIGIMSLLGLYLVIKRKRRDLLFISTWFATVALLLYFPIQFQRRMSEGLHIPMVILAVTAMIGLGAFIEIRLAPKMSFFLKSVFIWIVIIFSFPTTAYVVARDIIAYQKKDMPYYLSVSQVNGFAWLKDHTGRSDIILSDKSMGNFIPAYTARKVYYGHSDLSSNAEERKGKIEWFFDDQNGEIREKKLFLATNQIDYIYYQKEEPAADWLQGQNFLQKVFTDGTVEVFKVVL
jgi:hypothetical protein